MTVNPSTPSACEIISTRVFNFDQELVFKAWTDPEHLKNWWGPKGFTNTFNEFDLRPGGRWKFVMHAPDKGNFNNDVEFISIQKPSLIAWKRHSKPLFNIVAEFEKLTTDQTRLIFKMIFDTPEECAKLKPFVVDKNEENFDRLEAELARMTE